MRILFFASNNCPKCETILKVIKASGLPQSVRLEYIDAFDDDWDTFCDAHGVDELPHIKIYNNKNDLLMEQIGQCDISKLVKICNTNDETIKKFNLSKKKE